MKGKKKVCVVGLDGVNAKILHLMGIKPSVIFTLKSTIPPYTPPAWTSVLTGVNPGWHGIYSFLKYRGGGEALNTSWDVMFPRLFEMLAMNGLRSIIINVPLTYPFNALIGREKYVVVPDWASPAQTVWPHDLQRRYGEYMVKPPHTITLEGQHFTRDMRPRDYTNVIYEYLRARIDLYYELFDNHEWSLFFIVFSETDWVLHKVPQLLEGRGLNLAWPILSSIKSFIEHVSSKCDLTLIVSDHGFEHKQVRINVNAFLASKGLIRHGYMLGRGNIPVISTQKRSRISLPITKLLRVVQGRAVSYMLRKDFLRRLLPLTTFVDTKRSIAFMGDSGSWGVYVRRKEHVNYVLRTLRSMPGVSRVVRANHIYTGPYVDRGPQLITIPRGGVELTNGLHGDVIVPISQGGHEIHGVLAAIGDYEIKYKGSYATVFDVTPTLLRYLGLPLPEICEGRPILEEQNPTYVDHGRLKYLLLFRRARIRERLRTIRYTYKPQTPVDSLY